MLDSPIHEISDCSILISELSALSCGRRTALNPNTRPVLIVPDGRKDGRKMKITVKTPNDWHLRRIVLIFLISYLNLQQRLQEFGETLFHVHFCYRTDLPWSSVKLLSAVAMLALPLLPLHRLHFQVDT